MPETTRTCPTCGKPVSASFPEGLCPACLLSSPTAPFAKDPSQPRADSPATSRPATASMGPAPRVSSRVPTVEALQPWFPGIEILELLGAGGMGAVYKARQPRLNRLVALKVLLCPPEWYDNFVLRFEMEAQVMARLSHPHIVTIHDFGEIDRSAAGLDTLFYFLMEYVDGTDLNHLIRSGDLPPQRGLALVPQICDALQFAHDEGFTHRDIKPANLLVDKKGVVKIADFGLAKLIRGDETLAMGLTVTGTSLGTPHYMAPEVWETPETVDHRADIYSLGVVLYEMLTGERPAGVFDPPSRKVTVDPRVDAVVFRAMERDPARRYQQAREIRDALARIGEKPTPPAPRSRRGIIVGSLVGLAVAAALAGLAFGPSRWQDRPSAAADAPAGKTTPPTAAATDVGTADASPWVGELRSAGTHTDGSPIDLSRAAGHADFVEVILTGRGWVARRQTGELVTSLPTAPAAGQITRLLRGRGDSYGTIDATGRLTITSGSGSSPGVTQVPDEVQQRGVVDASWGEGHAIALLRDGTARVWGERYDSDFRDTTRWTSPPPAALTGVKKIATMRYRAATLTQAGDLHCWGGVPGFPSQIESTAGFSRWGQWVDVASGWSNLRLLTADGKMISLGGEPPLSSGLLVEGVAETDGFLHRLSPDAPWQWHPSTDLIRTELLDAAQTKIQALLQGIGTRPGHTFHLRLSERSEDTVPVGAIWIEPRPATATPASPAPSPVRAIPLAADSSPPAWLTDGLATLGGDIVSLAGWSNPFGADDAPSEESLLAIRADGTVACLIAPDNPLASAGLSEWCAQITEAQSAVVTAAGVAVLRRDGSVMTRGLASWGTPAEPALRGPYTQLAGGHQHVAALRADGTVLAWGDNRSGQVTPPPGLADVESLRCGHLFTIARHRDGSLTTWGLSGAKEITPPQLAPGDLLDWAAVRNGVYLLHPRGEMSAFGWRPGGDTWPQIRPGSDAVALAAQGDYLAVRTADGQWRLWSGIERGSLRPYPGGPILRGAHSLCWVGGCIVAIAP